MNPKAAKTRVAQYSPRMGSGGRPVRLINSDRPQQAGFVQASIFNELRHRAHRKQPMKSRMNEAFFSFFACTQRHAASGPIKAYMSLSIPRGSGRRVEKSQNRYWLHPTEWRTPAKRSQYSFDGRSFNINCGFSADGNVFFIGTVTL